MNEEQQQLSGRELDKAIAVALGYTVKTHPIFGFPAAQLFKPDGTEVFPFGNRDYVFENQPNAWRSVPPFSSDANAVIAVCTEHDWHLSFSGNTALIAYPIGGDFARTHRGDGTTPQETAARALLAALEAAREVKS